jgi:hypothetical protein
MQELTSQLFAEGVSPKKTDELLYFDRPEDVGFSILRKYSSKGRFFPAKTKDGKDDSVALIRIAIFTKRKKRN